MKITSEITNKEYATVEECLKAEAEFKSAKEQAASNKTSTEKKKLVDVIEACEKATNVAYENLEIAKSEVREMYAKSKKELEELIDKRNEEMSKVLEPVEKAVKDAERAKYNAISNFNKQFGVYRKVYTGEDAIKDLKKSFTLGSILDFLDFFN